MVEFERSSNADPFHTLHELFGNNDPRLSLERKTSKAYATRIRLFAYATETMARQHRTHLFQLLVFGRYARFIRWDRGGALVSDLVDYMLKPEVLAEFFWRYNHMSPEERGWDPTVCRPSDDEAIKFAEAVKRYMDQKKQEKALPACQDFLQEVQRSLDPTWPVWKITVEDDDDTEHNRYPTKTLDIVVQRPFYHPHTPIGRSTRAYIAYDVHAMRLLFFKDTWRVVHDLLQPESKLYARLRLAFEADRKERQRKKEEKAEAEAEEKLHMEGEGPLTENDAKKRITGMVDEDENGDKDKDYAGGDYADKNSTKEEWAAERKRNAEEVDALYEKCPFPEVECAGDVRVNGIEQKTQTKAWLPVDPNNRAPSGPIREFVHHRILQKILYPADSVNNSRQFVLFIFMCLRGQSNSSML